LSHSPLAAFCDATILTGEAVVENHALLVGGGSIVDIVPNRHVPAEAQKIACGGQILAPGLIDAQVNGGGNAQFNNDPSAATCLTIAKAHRAYGTTRLLPTCITDTPDITRRAVAAVREAGKTDPSILGIHLEGPHLAKDRRGIHHTTSLRSLNADDLTLYRRAGDEVMLITLAPETVGVKDIENLAKQAIVSIGHTNALPEQIRAALAAGASGFTHLYNGMGGMDARSPNVVGTALDDRNSWCGLIADGHHVAPEMIRLALRAKPVGKVFLVSDAMAPAATTTPKDFLLYGDTIHTQGTRCATATGTLAGSAVTLLDCVRHCVRNVGIDLDEALRMASTYPAAFLGLGHRLGKLLPTYTADIIAVDEALSLKGVWVEAEKLG